MAGNLWRGYEFASTGSGDGDASSSRDASGQAYPLIVIVPISSVDGGWTRVRKASEGLAATLRAAGLRVRLDDREEIRPGFKFNEWELRGVPLRLELGERELDNGQATLVRRDTGAKERTSTDGVASRARELLAEIQRRLLEEAHAFAPSTRSRIRRATKSCASF